jgi:poly(3-hydroxybutyrate) depolymerase
MGLPSEGLGRRIGRAFAVVLLPVAASSTRALGQSASAMVHRLHLLATWGGGFGEVFAGAALSAFSGACTVAAALAVAIAVTRILRGHEERLERSYLALRALVLLHGAAGPFLALSATSHLSPTVRGRVVLARDLAVVLEHQAYLTFAAAAVAAAWAIGRRGAGAEVDGRARAARSVLVPSIACAVGCRLLAETFARAATGVGVASQLELQLGTWVTTVAALTLVATVVAARSAPRDATPKAEDGPSPKSPLAAVPRTLATLLLPLFALTVVCWASSRPVDPDPADLSRVPTVAFAATRPLPLARTEAEASAEEGVLVADEGKRLREVWPRRAGVREIRLVVQRDRFERGSTGVFARFGDGRFGVLRMTFADRDLPPPTCPVTFAGRRCVEVDGETVAAVVAGLQASAGPYAFVVHTGAEETVGELARDAARLLVATYDGARSSPLDLDVDLLVSLAASAPTAPQPRATSRPPRPSASPHAEKTPPSPVDPSLPVPSPGCTPAHAAASFEPHELTVDGAARRLFVSAPAGAEGARPLVVVMPGDGSSAEAIRRELPLEPRLGATSVVVYLEARGGEWDLEAPLGANADVAFVRAAALWVQSAFCVDLHRRFVTGFGGGGTLASSLACEGDFDAVVAHGATGPAPVDGEPDSPSGLFRCKPAAALVIQGANDVDVLCAGGARGAEVWRLANRCGEGATIPPCETFRGCDHPVERCLVPGLGHALAADAAERTAAFFERVR